MTRAVVVSLLLALSCTPAAPRPDLEVLAQDASPEEAFRSARWEPARGVPHFGLDRTAVWVRLSAANLTGQHQHFVLEVGAPWLDRVDFYLETAGGLAALSSAGDTLPFPERSVVHRNPSAAFEIPAGGSVRIYAKAGSRGVLTVPMRLWYADDFFKKAQGEYLTHGLYFGVLSALLVYNLILFVFVRERSYVFYCIYLASILLYYALQNGFILQFFPDTPAVFMNEGMLAAACLSGFAVTLFTHSFLAVRSVSRILDMILRVQMWILGAAFAVCLFADYRISVRLVNAVMPLSAVVFLSTSIYCGAKGIRQSRYFILAWSCVICAIIVESLTSVGLLDITWAGRFGTQVGTVVEVVLFSVALGRRIRTLSEEKAVTQSRLAAIEKDLEMARAIQERILPQEMPDVRGASVAALYRPLKGVGGDFYDFHQLESQKLGVLVADVTGHGMSAALDSSTVKIAFRNERQELASPVRLLSNMNRFLKPLTDYRFVSAQYAFFDLERMQLTLGTAGHPPLIRLRNGAVEFLESEGMLLGLDPEAEYIPLETDLREEDRFVFYTDGLSETEAGFDADRAALRSLMLTGAKLPASRFLDQVVVWLEQRPAPVGDDVTVVVVDIARR